MQAVATMLCVSFIGSVWRNVCDALRKRREIVKFLHDSLKVKSDLYSLNLNFLVILFYEDINNRGLWHKSTTWI